MSFGSLGKLYHKFPYELLIVGSGIWETDICIENPEVQNELKN
jgi:hypothetical protein